MTETDIAPPALHLSVGEVGVASRPGATYADQVLKPLVLQSFTFTDADKVRALASITFEQLETFSVELFSQASRIECLGFTHVSIACRAAPFSFLFRVSLSVHVPPFSNSIKIALRCQITNQKVI